MPMILVDYSYSCNLNCVYCYNKFIRQALKDVKPNLEKVKEAIRRAYEQYKASIILHGGEPLTWGYDVVEELLRLSHELTGKSGLQSNCTLINDEWIRLFKRYNTHVGASIDGWGKLNRFRCDEKCTEKVIENILTLKQERISVGVIIVLSKANAVGDNLKELCRFIKWLDDHGIKGKINPCYYPWSYDVMLTPEELAEAYTKIAKFMLEEGITGWQPFYDIIDLLLGNDKADCIFTPCDPFCTSGAVVIDGEGNITTCWKFASANILRVEPPLHVRQDVLRHTDCAGCKYFGRVCHGLCPATAINMDWRNKSVFCLGFKALYKFYERLLRTLMPNIRLAVDSDFDGDPFKYVRFSAWRGVPPEYIRRMCGVKDQPVQSLESREGVTVIRTERGEYRHLDTPHVDHHKHLDSG